jgi:hypothetical protein
MAAKLWRQRPRFLDKAASAGDIPSFQAMIKPVPLLGLKPEDRDDRLTSSSKNESAGSAALAKREGGAFPAPGRVH